jgi:hypothetical protein
VIDLLARPAQYERRPVKVVGVLATATNGIFISREHAELSMAEYGIALALRGCDGESLKEPARFADLPVDNMKYVIAEATFSTGVTGHLGEFPSGLCAPVSIRNAEIEGGR